MDPIIAVIIVGVINMAGWVYTRVYSMGKLKGKLNGKIDKLEKDCERHEKVLNDGLVQELTALKVEVANLTGTLETYIDLTKK